MATEESRLSNRWAGLNREKLGKLGNVGNVISREKERLGEVLNREKLGQVFSREKLGNVNVGKTERWASVLGGAALAALALKQGRKKSALGLAALAGLPLIWRGATGHCAVYQKLGIDKTNGQAGTSLANTHTDQGSSVTTEDLQPVGQTF